MDGRRSPMNGLPRIISAWMGATMTASIYGLIENGASIYNDPLTGDSIVLNGTNQYVALPPGLANAETFAAVFKWSGGAAWQRVFDFGNGTNSYVFLTPMASTGFPRFTITGFGMGGEQHLDSRRPPCHCQHVDAYRHCHDQMARAGFSISSMARRGRDQCLTG